MNYPLYLDYAATTPIHPEVLDAMLPFLKENFGNASSRHHAYGWVAEEAVDTAKSQIRKGLNCNQKEIVFTSGSTESINLALKGADIEQIITFRTEHKATLDVCKTLGKQGKKIHFVLVNENGEADLADLKTAAQRAKSLVSVLWVNNETGLIMPIPEIAEICEATDSILHVDATQALGKIPVDFKNSGIDLMSFSAHKIYGPKGMGGLLVKENLKIEAQIDGGGHQRGMRSGTLNVPGIVGLGKAVSLIEQNASEKFKSLQAYFENEILKSFDFCRINAGKANRVGLICNIRFGGYDGEDLLMKLHKIAVSNGSACNSASTLPSHVLKAMGQTDEEAYAGIRFSFSSSNTEADVDFALEHLREVLL